MSTGIFEFLEMILIFSKVSIILISIILILEEERCEQNQGITSKKEHETR